MKFDTHVYVDGLLLNCKKAFFKLAFSKYFDMVSVGGTGTEST
jgi:hypothetical protein